VSSWTPAVLGAGFLAVLLGAGLMLTRRFRRA
jgi:LPXTG-motif cell wall-anchored protein